MLKWLWNYFSPAAEEEEESEALLRLGDFISRSGRVPLRHLGGLARAMDAAQFSAYVKVPLLVGWGIREGTLAEAADPDERKRGKTLFFRPAEMFALARAAAETSESLQEAIYPLMKGKESASGDPRIFTIGRQAGNDFVIPDFAVSKKHARIDASAQRYYLTDLGSSNGTAINGTPLPRPKVELSFHDKLRFGRYEFTFVSPEMLHELLQRRSA